MNVQLFAKLKNLFRSGGRKKTPPVDIQKRFDLIGKVGQGSMSKVYSARDRQVGGKLVCLKVLDKEKTAKFEARFIGLNRPTTSWSRPVIWPNEATSTTSSKAGKQFSPRSTTSTSLSSARFALSAFFFLNFLRRSTCSCCFARGVRASFISGTSSSPLRYLFKPMIGRVPS